MAELATSVSVAVMESHHGVMFVNSAGTIQSWTNEYRLVVRGSWTVLQRAMLLVTGDRHEKEWRDVPTVYEPV